MSTLRMRARAWMASVASRAGKVISRQGYLSAVAAVVTATALFVPLREHLGREQWGWPYMLVVGLIAGTAGIGPALLAAALGFLAWNFFFFPPYYTLRVAQSGDLVHLGAFLIVALAIGWQTGRLREREAAALREERHLLALNQLSGRLVSDDAEETMGLAVAEAVPRLLEGSEAVVWTFGPDAQPVLSRFPQAKVSLEALRRAAHASRDEALSCARSGSLPFPTVEEQAAHPQDGDPNEPYVHWTIISHALCAGGYVEGVLQVLIPGERDLPDESDYSSLASAAHFLAAFLRTRRLSRAAMHMAAEREAERLRSALVSSVSHELKTPLASITAAVTDLVDPEVQRSPEEFVERLCSVSQDLDRLDSAIADLLDVSRLEAKAWAPRPEEYELGEVLGHVIAQIPAEACARIDLVIPDNLPTIHVDFTQIARALSHIVDNALLYSSDRVTIRGTAPVEGVVTLSVEDKGPGIADKELPFVFDKFYRGSSGKESRSSTGLGLAIAREIVTANHGQISIESIRPHGARFVITLPTVAAEETL